MSRTAPGPSALDFAWGVRSRGFIDEITRQWEAHGDLFAVRLGGRTVMIVIHPDAVEQVNQTRRQRYAKLDSYDAVRRFLTGDGLVTSNGELWKRQRRLMAPFFTRAGVQTFADVMTQDALRLAERWEGLADAGAEVDLSDEMTRVTASIILRAMFSTESEADVLRMKESVEEMTAYVNQHMVGMPLPLWVPTPGNLRYKAARNWGHDFTSGLIAARRALDEAEWPDDLLTRLMRARDPDTGEPMTEVLLRDEALTIFFAGHETTARTLTFIWYILATHPEVAQRLREELDRELGDGPVTLEALHRLPYALQVVKETQRLYPAVPVYARDAAEADEIGDIEVPKGASLLFSSYHTHRHPDFWEDPLTFDPSRWTPEKEAAQHKFAYHPFASGPRTCIGNNLSLLETHIVVAILARRFTCHLREGWTPKLEMQGVLGLEGGLPGRLERVG